MAEIIFKSSNIIENIIIDDEDLKMLTVWDILKRSRINYYVRTVCINGARIKQPQDYAKLFYDIVPEQQIYRVTCPPRIGSMTLTPLYACSDFIVVRMPSNELLQINRNGECNKVTKMHFDDNSIQSPRSNALGFDSCMSLTSICTYDDYTIVQLPSSELLWISEFGECKKVVEVGCIYEAMWNLGENQFTLDDLKGMCSDYDISGETDDHLTYRFWKYIK